ncbi:hypothetical protein [Escherichia coli]|uniref:hypothetical protein n=1 Tax=Escherichia coli TaxID=562 RepID=UPI0032DADA13
MFWAAVQMRSAYSGETKWKFLTMKVIVMLSCGSDYYRAAVLFANDEIPGNVKILQTCLKRA